MEEETDQLDFKNNLGSELGNSQQEQSKSKKLYWLVITVTIIAIGIGLYVWSLQSLSQESENITTEVENEQNNQTQDELKEEASVPEKTKKILYKADNDLILFNPNTAKKNVILNSTDVLDFDLSEDQKYIVYSLKESGFEGNSDIYIKNLTNEDTVRLTEKNDIASLNPIIFSDNSKVTYVERVFDQATKKLSDGEIWMIDSDGNAGSSKKLFSSNNEFLLEESGLNKVFDENDEWTGEYFCISQEEIVSPKIGIRSISPDNATISYWQKEVAPECSGLRKTFLFSNLDGTDFFTEEFRQQNTFNFYVQDQDQRTFNWLLSKIFWFDDGSFVLEQGAPAPIEGKSIYYFDRDQNKEWEIFDSFKQEDRNDTRVIFDDVRKKEDDRFIIAYRVYKRFEDTKYFIGEFSLGDKIDISNLSSKKYFAVEKLNNQYGQISNVKFLDNDYLVYAKKLGENSHGLYLYNITKNKEQEITKTNSVPEFKI